MTKIEKAMNKKKEEKVQLKAVTIRGFKSISFQKPLTIELDNVNILLGANGSGKSNIISFFRMLNYMMSGSFQFFIEQCGTSQIFLHYGSTHTETINGELRFESDTIADNYKFALTHATPDRLIIKSEEVSWSKNGNNPQIIPLESTFKESALSDRSALADRQDKMTLQIIRKILSDCKVYQFHDSSAFGPLRQSSHKDVSNYLQSEGKNLAPFLYYLKENFHPYYNKIIRYIQAIMPQFQDFYLEPNEKGYIMLKWTDVSPNDYVLLPEQFSDGTIRFIALATLLLQPPNTMPNVIIIDKPELGLHPFAIGQLSEMIKDASLHVQVIVATQSPELVDEFDANQITVVERDEESECTVAHKLKDDELADWLSNYSLSELWDKNVIGGRP